MSPFFARQGKKALAKSSPTIFFNARIGHILANVQEAINYKAAEIQELNPANSVQQSRNTAISVIRAKIIDYLPDYNNNDDIIYKITEHVVIYNDL